MVHSTKQERIELPYGVYSGEVRDGKPNGNGTVQFRQEDEQVCTGKNNNLISKPEKFSIKSWKLMGWFDKNYM